MKSNNIWNGLKNNSKRRIDPRTNVFAYVTVDGYKSLLIELDEETDFKKIQNLKFLNFKLIVQDNKNIYLILSDMKSIGIFEYLSLDIVEHLIDVPKNLVISEIIKILNIWKELFREKKNNIPEIIQMGLFSELIFLKNNELKKISTEKNIQGWNGPEGDKQDFSFKSCDVEIKSRKANKKNEINISSERQLEKNKEELYLVCYSLLTNIEGKTIKDLVIKILEKIDQDCPSMKTWFLKKVVKYGYNPFKNYDNLIPFSIEEVILYEVNDDFPKIVPKYIDLRVSSVSYKIDLSLCKSSISTELRGLENE